MNQQNTSLKQLFSNISNSSKDPLQKDLWIGWYFSFVCCVVSVIGLILDDRILQYVPIWLKPFKFSVSSLIFIGSILYFLKYIETLFCCSSVLLVDVAKYFWHRILLVGHLVFWHQIWILRTRSNLIRIEFFYLGNF